jgi:hypothetical protein
MPVASFTRDPASRLALLELSWITTTKLASLASTPARSVLILKSALPALKDLLSKTESALRNARKDKPSVLKLNNARDALMRNVLNAEVKILNSAYPAMKALIFTRTTASIPALKDSTERTICATNA